MENNLKKILSNHSKMEDLRVQIQDKPDLFDSLFELALNNIPVYSWRAAWILEKCMEQNDERIIEHIEKIIDILPERGDGHTRGLLLILLKMEILEDCEGKLFDFCIRIWEQIGRIPSLRITAFKTILKIIAKYPELSGEIDYLIQPHYLETLSPGVKHSVKRLISIKQFKKH